MSQHVAQKAPEEVQVEEKGTVAPKDSRRLLLLLHGQKAGDEMVRDAIKRLRDEGHHVLVRVTYEAGDVDRLVKEALTLKSADTLVAAGGDGTICEVVAALLKHTGGLKDTRDMHGIKPEPPTVKAKGDPPMLQQLSVGILPMGTSNDFAATTGIPEDPYEALLLATKPDHMKPLDVGLLNGKVFMNTATIGASAEVGKVTSSDIKKVLGPAAFLVTGAKSVTEWSPVSSVLCFPNIKENGSMKEQKQSPDEPTDLAKALIDEVPVEGAHAVRPGDKRPSKVTEEPAGSKDKDAEAPTEQLARAASQTNSGIAALEGVPLLHVTAANNRQIASMVSVAPDAVLDDGMLDCVYLTGLPSEQMKRIIWEAWTKGIEHTKAVSTLLRVPWLEIATENPIEWSLDGEPQDEPSNSFRFSLLHRAVKFHLPDDRMLVAGQPTPEAEDPNRALTKSGKKRDNPKRLPRGRLHPPTLGDVLGRVVRFRKKRNWAQSALFGAEDGEQDEHEDEHEDHNDHHDGSNGNRGGGSRNGTSARAYGSMQPFDGVIRSRISQQAVVASPLRPNLAYHARACRRPPMPAAVRAGTRVLAFH